MHNEKEQLKIELSRIKANEYNLGEGEKAADYLGLMLKYVGDTDPMLRDSLIYSTFVHWIEIKKYFSGAELINILETILQEDYIFFNIGSEGDDSVFKRSFSALLINPILCVHLDKPFLTKDRIQKTKNCLIQYFDEERDLRGHVEEKGWAHGLAHAADSISILLACEGIEEADCKRVLESIEKRLLEGKQVWSAEEDERFVSILYYSIMDNKLLKNGDICSWLTGLAKVLDIQDKMMKYRARINVKSFIRSLYFRVLHLAINPEISNAIAALEKRLNNFVD